MKLSDEIVQFFKKQGPVIVSTVDEKGYPHNSCKGIIELTRSGKVYIIDLYKKKTYENLKRRMQIAITSVDEHRFKGYCLKGRASIITGRKLTPRLLKAWDKKINNRIFQRIIRNIHGEKGHQQHPEALLPKPEYLIVMKIKEVIDLTPQHIKG